MPSRKCGMSSRARSPRSCSGSSQSRCTGRRMAHFTRSKTVACTARSNFRSVRSRVASSSVATTAGSTTKTATSLTFRPVRSQSGTETLCAVLSGASPLRTGLDLPWRSSTVEGAQDPEIPELEGPGRWACVPLTFDLAHTTRSSSTTSAISHTPTCIVNIDRSTAPR